VARKEEIMKNYKRFIVLLIALLVFNSVYVLAESQVFTGLGHGHNGDVKVDVVFGEDGSIEEVTLAEQAETPHIAQIALDSVPGWIVEYNSVAVDTVAGATMTSRAIINGVRDAISQAGYDEANYKKEMPKENEKISLETDVVIVGAGGAGLSAAIEAAQAGARVLVVETNAYAGGASKFALGMVLYAADEEEASANKALTAEQLCAGIQEHNAEHANAELLLDYLKHSKENVEWLTSMCPEGTYVVQYAPGNYPTGGMEAADYTYATVNASESDPGMYYIDALYAAAQNAGVEFLLSTTADEILTNDGIVCGIHAAGQNGNDYTIAAQKVILACGGYGGNYNMMLETSNMDRPFYLGPTSNKGFGILAAEELGAKVEINPMVVLEGFGQDVYSTYGGLVVNIDAEVLSENDEAIENLYAAGEISCVQIVDPDHFVGGENLSWNIYSGRIAGRNAAKTQG